MAGNLTANPPERIRAEASRQRRFELRDKTWRWILLLPAVVVVVVLLIGPVLWTLYAAFTDMHLFRIGVETKFVGLKNFQKLLENESFWRTVRNTVVFMLGVLPAQVIIGMVVAVCLDNVTVGRKFFRTWFLMPMMISPVVVSFVVGRMLFAEDIGPINEGLRALGFKGIPWFTHPTWAMITLIIVDVWQWSSFMILMIMAGLQGIPPDLHEAARVDGASAWQGYWYITLPLLVPIMVTALLIRAIDAFKVADIIMVLTGGGPGQATETVTVAIYRAGVKGGDLALGSSQAYLLLVIMLVFGGAFLFMSRRSIKRG
ncbi:MAG: sugar ABC transporter permease [Caldilineaceae bacterium]